MYFSEGCEDFFVCKEAEGIKIAADSASEQCWVCS
jgi:hypothetical protein